MSENNKLKLALLSLRLGVFIVMLMWTIDKFVNPEHAGAVYSKFYSINGLENYMFMIIGIVELVILIAFLVGYKKRLTYGIVFLIHAVSTLSSYQQYLDPFTSPNLLFFAAWPMLAACFTLYYLRDQDVMWNLGNKA